MKRMYQYSLTYDRTPQEVIMPDSAYIHSVIIDNYGIDIYALVDPTDEKKSVKKFLVAYTGQSLENWQQLNFLGSGRVHEQGGIVYHVFQILG